MSKNKLAIPRLTHFVAMLKENRYPNHPMLVREMQKLDIAGAYSITQKTLQRDVAFLRGDYGAPIEYDYARHGYYLTDPLWTWDIPQLNDSDLDSAILAAHITESIMPPPLGIQARKTVDSLLSSSDFSVKHADILLSLVATGAGIPIKPDIFKEIFQGWLQRRVLLIGYTRGMDGESSEMTIEPQIIAFYEGCWYLKVKVRHADNPLFQTKSIVTLALHRIFHVVATSMSFESDSQMISQVQQGFFFEFPKISNIHLHVRGKGYRFAMERFAPKIIKQYEDGSSLIELPDTEEYKIINFLFAWPGEVVVISPKKLRETVCDYAKMIFELHKGKAVS